MRPFHVGFFLLDFLFLENSFLSAGGGFLLIGRTFHVLPPVGRDLRVGTPSKVFFFPLSLQFSLFVFNFPPPHCCKSFLLPAHRLGEFRRPFHNFLAGFFL